MAAEMDPTQEPELSADEAWEREQGIPQLSDPFIQKYFQGRDALIAQEDKHRSDRDFRDLLSPMAQEACAIVDQIRFEELQTVWVAEDEQTIGNPAGDIFPGMMFSMARERMEQTKLWKIIKKMPKGALLHMHLEAMVDQTWLFNTALEQEGIYIDSPSSLATAESRRSAPVLFSCSTEKTSPSTSIWAEDHPVGTPVPFKAAADSFPDGGRAGLVAWLVSRCSISDVEALNHHHGLNSIWRKFYSCFRILGTLVAIEPILRKFLQKLFSEWAEDGINWADIRAVFPLNFQAEGANERDLDPKLQFTVIQEEIDKFKATEEGKDFWGARIIWTALRRSDNRSLAENMNMCIEAKIEFPDLIAGFDLVGQEDLGRPLADLTPMIFWFRKQCAQEGVSIPFFFHAGETCMSGGHSDLNLFDAILLGTRRIGHGYSLYKHPLLMNMVKDKRVLVEVCPVSNEVLRLNCGVMQHPLPALLAQGVPVALSNDDPAILGQRHAGLTHDFYQVILAVENLGLHGLGALAENSVRWATLEDDIDAKDWTQDIKNGAFGQGIRAKRLKQWKSAWEKYCQWIVMEFGADIDLDPEE